jgi:hypothetical protein
MGVHYLTRTEHLHAKAGNINHAFKQTHGELIALFDADGIPRRDFLTKLVGYFDEEKVALVQTPNAFYNLDSFQHWSEENRVGTWNEQSLWYDVILRGLDYDNAATWCGSGSLFRRSAFEKIGGVPVDSVTEDALASLELHDAGYDTVYHDEAIAFSLAPDSIEPYLVQRSRWALGSIQILRRHFFRILFSRSMAFVKKRSYLLSLYYFTSIQKLFYFTGTFVYLCLDISPVYQADRTVIPLTIYVILSSSMYVILARGTSRVLRGEVYFLHLIPVYVTAIFQGLLPYVKWKFKVTPKNSTEWVHLKYWIMPLFVFGLSVAAVWSGTMKYLEGESTSYGVIFTTVAGIYYAMISLAAMQVLSKRPVSYSTNHFFDFLPLKITQLGRSSEVPDALGVSYMISNEAVHFLHQGAMPVGEAITLDLDLPSRRLSLTGDVKRCQKWEPEEISPLYIVEVRLERLDDETSRELSLYYFEHATPRAVLSTTGAVRQAIERFVEARAAKTEEVRERKISSFAPVKIQGHGESGEIFGVVKQIATSGATLRLNCSIMNGTQVRLCLPWSGSEVIAIVESSEPESWNPGAAFLVETKFEQKLETGIAFFSGINRIFETGEIRVRVI